MAIPLIYMIAAAAAGAAVLTAERDDGVEGLSSATGGFASRGFKSVTAKPVESPRLTGPLPAAALAAWNAPKHGKRRSRSTYVKGGVNDIHKRQSWVRYATYSDKFDYKLDKQRIYSDPPGALYLLSKSNARNLAWMFRCKPEWYPGYGKASPRNIRFDLIERYLGPKADWSTLKGGIKSSIAAIPKLVSAAGVITGGVASGGASLSSNPEKQTRAIVDGLKAALEPIGDVGDSVSKRREAAAVIWNTIANQYILQMMAANPWAVRDGKFTVGKKFAADPLTYEDLYKEGKSRPLLWNP